MTRIQRPSDLAPSRQRWLDRAEHVLDSTPSRLVLSFLIVLSVLPERVVVRHLGPDGVTAFPWFFLAIFGVELFVRSAIFARRLRERRAGRWEAALLLLDFLAVVSFLPWHWMAPDLEVLRLARLARMLLLFGYWGGVVRDLWAILAGRERSRHVVFVLLGGILLSFSCAVILSAAGPAFDYDDDGTIDDVEDRSFQTILWWSFRQVQDPGNLVERPEQAVIVAASLVLTFGGLLLFSFLVGVGTSAVEELVAQSRLLPVGLRGHTVIVGVGPHSHFLLHELGEIYRKNFASLRAAVLGTEARPPDALRDRRLRSVRYRAGEVDSVEDLARLDLRWASRVIVLGGARCEHLDARVISSTLAVRSLDPTIELYPVLEHEKSFPAARAAGGPGTHLIAAGSFLGFYLAQNVLDPGIYRLYRQLLTSAGCEIYTYVFSADERAAIRSAGHGRSIDLRGLWLRGHAEHGVGLLGLFVAEPGRSDLGIDDLDVLLDLPDPAAPEGVLDSEGRLRCAALRGLIGICLRFEDLRRLARQVVAAPTPEAPPPADPPRVPLPELRPWGPPPRRVLICGGSPRIPRLLELLGRGDGDVETTILVREPARVESLVEEISSALEGNLSGLSRAPARRVDVRRVGPGVVVHRPSGGAGAALTVRIRVADWTDVSQLLRQPDVDLGAADAILFLPVMKERSETDGLVALDCLRMAQLAASGQIALRPGTRVLGVVEDPAKGDLLEQRLLAMDDLASRFTIVASERVRHHYVMQNLFVPGLHRFYFELVGSSEVRLRRLCPAELEGRRPRGPLDAGDLAAALCRTGRTFVGLELEAGPDRPPEVVLDPHELRRRVMVWESVRAIYTLSR